LDADATVLRGRYFQRAQKDVFLLRSADLGKLTLLQVWHNNKRPMQYNNNGGELRQCQPGWFLEKVVVEKLCNGALLEATTFACSAWLNEERWEKIEVRLRPGGHQRAPAARESRPEVPPCPGWWPGAPASAVADRDPRVDMACVHTPTAGLPKQQTNICRGRAAQRGTYGARATVLPYGIPRGSSTARDYVYP
jgi:hypothetical protein